MIQIIQEKTFGSDFGTALGAGLGKGMSEGFETAEASKKQMADIAKENEEIYNATGIKLRGVTPETRKAEFTHALKLKQEEHKQGLKQERQQGFLEKLYGGNQQQPKSQQTQQEFDPGQISDENILEATSIDPALGRELRAAKDTALRENRLNKKESTEYKRDEQIAKSQAQADIKYNQDLQSSKRQHEIKNQTLNRLEELNKKGVTGKPFEKILEKSGLIALTSEGRREFAAEQKNLITDIRSILGSQFSTFEFQTILNAFPSPDFSKEANAAIIKNLKDFQNIKDQEYIIANALKKENGGKLPDDYQTKVNERVQEYAERKLPEIKENTRKIMAEQYGIKPGNILMFDPKGEPLDVSPEEVERYQSLGATLP